MPFAQNMLGRRIALVAGLLASLSLTGCSGKEKVDYGKVRGSVTGEGKPVAQAVVIFVDEQKHIFKQATTDAAGHYDFDKLEGAGLPVGSYQVAVQKPIQEIETGKPIPPPKPYPKGVDVRLMDPAKSGLRLEVKVGENPLDVDLTAASRALAGK